MPIDWTFEKMREEAKRITFVKGEPVCRFDGILMTDEECIKRWGCCEADIYVYDDNMLLWGSTLYSGRGFLNTLRCLAIKEYNDVWEGAYINDSFIMTMYNIKLTAEQELEHILNNSLVICKDNIKEIKRLKPFSQFKKDHPNVNVKGFMEFMEAIDCYDEVTYHANKYK